MNVNMPVIGRLFVLALAVALGPGMQPATAQPSGLSLAQALQQADEFYQANKWVEAEPLYRQALNAAEGADRRRCFDRLLTIYVRVGRQDQAIQTGLKYADWLRRTGDHVRARTVELDLGKWYLALGHYADAEPHLRRALADFKGHPLPPARQILALTYLALATEKQGERARAGQAWREVEAFARARLDDTKLDLALRIECVRRLADSDRFQGRPKEAIPRLEQILPAFGELKKPDPVGQRDALRQLAGHLTAARRHADAEKYLKQARALHRQHAAGDLLTCADLSGELADVLERQGRTREAATLRREAAWDYRAILEDPRTGLPEGAGALGAFWKLQVLYQRTSQYDLALKLLQDQAEQWAGDLLEPRLYIELGRLQVLLGEYAPSRRLLAGAVAELEKQSPPNLIELPAALLNLGVAELATGDRGKAKERGERCLKVYEKYRLGDDLVLLETYNLLGICAAQDGDYAKAIDHFRAGVARCGWLGSPADPQHANLLLNLALLHKAQGELEKSLAACRDARAVYQRFAAKDALGFAALDAAAAALFAARARLEEANKLAGKVLELCAKHKIHKGPLVHTARHCQALFHLHRRD